MCTFLPRLSLSYAILIVLPDVNKDFALKTAHTDKPLA